MRVLHIVSGRLYGGVETALVTMARCRDLCPEIEPEFALCFDGRLRDELTGGGTPVHIAGRGSRQASRFRCCAHGAGSATAQ